MAKTIKHLQRIFSKIDFESELINFDYTDYYEAELGKDLKRKFVSFYKLINQSDISKIKIIINKLEEKLSIAGKRRVNIDPGYISDSKLVLATHKDFSHRIYLEKGVFAEVALSFSHGSFRPWPWTYPDYRTEKYIKIFNAVRELYIKQMSK